ncbi:MAG: nucleotidyltransferase domain-containing protein [Pseudomonadota bacterium]|nr:nucleotidyltransferase domain-containing protein [Pseudomonadota bacterium]
MDLQPLVHQLRQSLDGLLAVYLFGSHARDEARPDSDLDMAIYAGRRVDTEQLWALSGSLAAAANCDVDLVDLVAASTVMQYQIITRGRRLWALDSQASNYESFILSEKTELDTARAGLIADIRERGYVHGR